MSFYSEICDLILSKKIRDKQMLHKEKIRLCKKYKLSGVPSDSDIFVNLSEDFSDEEYEILLNILRRKPMRTISGVAIVAVMTSPWGCPHGSCIPCPGGPKSNTPQSYTGFEPAAMRASLNSFDPFLQTKNRLEQLQAIGHDTSKIDLIIMGGTFTSRDPFYQSWFVKRCFDAMNKQDSDFLDNAKKFNETAVNRCVGLTVETRPDWFRLRHIDEVLGLGATRVELGVQSVFDDVLYRMNRGHTVIDSINATRLGKDAGFKIVYHMMPGLPGSDFDRDLECFHSVFEDSDFKPDMIKIYPTLVVKGTPLYDMYKKGDYKPLSTDEASNLIAEVKGFIPEWIRIQRIQRDIPAQHIDQGVDKSNLRQIVEKEMEKKDLVCRCIRCREIGHKSLREDITLDKDDVVFDICNYDASDSSEVFISLVSRKYDALIGFLRLRDINNSHRSELAKKGCMIIRELKVVGRELVVGSHKKSEIQHSGFGKELVAEAERICVEDFDKKNLFVLSGVGVKNYYRNFGFKNNGVYLEKILK